MDTQDSIRILQLINVIFLIDLCAIAIGATVYQLTGDRTVRIARARPVTVPDSPESRASQERSDRRAA